MLRFHRVSWNIPIPFTILVRNLVSKPTNVIRSNLKRVLAIIYLYTYVVILEFFIP